MKKIVLIIGLSLFFFNNTSYAKKNKNTWDYPFLDYKEWEVKGSENHYKFQSNLREDKDVLKEFKNNKITILTGVNTLFNAMLNHKDFASLDFSSLKATAGGGMAVQKVVAEKWKEVTGCNLSEGYGLTRKKDYIVGSRIRLHRRPLDVRGRFGSAHHL
mgnify:CR=1 FL=1